MDVLVISLAVIGVFLCAAWLTSWLTAWNNRRKWGQVLDLVDNQKEQRKGKGWLESAILAQTQVRDLKISSDASTESGSPDSTQSNTHSGR